MFLIKNKKQKVPKSIITEKAVIFETVKNTSIPHFINETGLIAARNKIALYSEVQGVLNIKSKDFKTGTFYKKGETILSINTGEDFAKLLSSKSSLNNMLLAILPNIKIEFSAEYKKWEDFLQTSQKTEEPLPQLPETKGTQEKNFMTATNFYVQYYNVKSIEARLAKYNIRAPFDGTVTEALVNQGSLLRPGQKLGEFINAHNFELEVAVKSQYIHLIKTGKSVTLNNLEHTKSWQGKIVRVNGKIDQTTQTIRVFIAVKASDLYEGMYVEANLTLPAEPLAIEVNRKLLVDKNKLFAVKDSILFLVEVTPVFFNEKTVVVKNLQDGTKIISESVPGAYEGMKVKIKKQK